MHHDENLWPSPRAARPHSRQCTTAKTRAPCCPSGTQRARTNGAEPPSGGAPEFFCSIPVIPCRPCAGWGHRIQARHPDHAYTDPDRPKQTHSQTRTPPPTQYLAGGTEWRSQDIHTLLNASTGTPMRFGGDCEGTMVTVPGSATHGPELLVMGAIHHTGILIHPHVHPCVTTSPI